MIMRMKIKVVDELIGLNPPSAIDTFGLGLGMYSSVLV